MNRLTLAPSLALALALAAALPGAAQACGAATAGGLTVRDAWSRAVPLAGRPGALYLQIENAGPEDDALVGLATPVSEMPMLHESVTKDGVTSMPHVAAVPVPAGATVQLAPGGYHGMLMGLAAPLKEGETFPVTLTFQKAGAVEVTVTVQSLRSQAAECGAGG